MRRTCLLLGLGAMACLAQDQGFVNKRLLKADFLKAKAPVPLKQLPPGPCMKVPRAEHIPILDVDKAMVIRPQGPSPDPLMVIWPKSICVDGK
jgi:hypothetical protein